MLFLLISAALICSTAAANSLCSSLYVSYDLSPNFNETIAHSIHSMTVQGLRLFNPRATEDNRVPTVNHDIHDEVTSSVVILFYCHFRIFRCSKVIQPQSPMGGWGEGGRCTPLLGLNGYVLLNRICFSRTRVIK